MRDTFLKLVVILLRFEIEKSERRCTQFQPPPDRWQSHWGNLRSCLPCLAPWITPQHPLRKTARLLAAWPSSSQVALLGLHFLPKLNLKCLCWFLSLHLDPAIFIRVLPSCLFLGNCVSLGEAGNCLCDSLFLRLKSQSHI